MGRPFRLPDLGSGLKEGRILAWRVKVGDRVTTDAVLCEVETEKAAIEIPVPFDGVVEELAVPGGATVAVGAVLAVIGAGAEASAHGEAAETTREPTAGPARPRAMPSVRKLARGRGLDLSQIKATGKQGRVTRKDVASVATEIKSAPAMPASGTTAPASSSRREELSMLRKTIARNLTRSWREIPHVFTRLDVDATRLFEMRTALAKELGRPLPLEALLVKAVIPLLREFPAFNAAVEGDEMVFFERYDIGIAVDTSDGLLVPVLKAADSLQLGELARRLAELLERAPARKLKPEELTGATFTVNNLGALGHLAGTSIIPYGTTAILSVGRAAPKAVVEAAQLVARPVMEVALSFDHRAIDGGLAQRFMRRIHDSLDQPIRFLAR